METHQPRLPAQVDCDLFPVKDPLARVGGRWFQIVDVNCKVRGQIGDRFSQLGID